MSKIDNISKINDLLLECDSVLLLTHINPDGDAIGSSLSLYNALLAKYINVDIYIKDAPKIFSFLPNYDKITKPLKDNYDLVIVTDCATLDRVGQEEHYFENAKYTVNIDHHISNTNYANYNFVLGNSPACCEYLYNIYKKLNIDITDDMAECLITGILTDTGGLQYSQVNANTFLIASRLSKKVNIPEIYKKVLSTKTKAQFEFSKIAINRIEFYCNNKIAFTNITLDDMKQTNASYGDHEGIVNIGRDIEGVEVSIFIREDVDGYKVSLRSNGLVDVNKIASIFNGGGHHDAAGISIKMDYIELKNKLISLISEQLNG